METEVFTIIIPAIIINYIGMGFLIAGKYEYNMSWGIAWLFLIPGVGALFMGLALCFVFLAIVTSPIWLPIGIVMEARNR